MTNDEEKAQRVLQRSNEINPTGKATKRTEQAVIVLKDNPAALEEMLSVASAQTVAAQAALSALTVAAQDNIYYTTGKRVLGPREKKAAARNKEFTDLHPEMRRLAKEFCRANPNMPLRGKISAAARHIEKKKGWPFNTVRQIISDIVKNFKTEL